MASIIKRGSLWLVLLSACDGGDKEKKPLPDGAVEETGVTTPTAETGDPTVDVWPICEHTGRTEPITLLGANRLDYLGASIDVADVDGDGCEEIAVAATWSYGYYQPGEGAVYLLSVHGLVSGDIDTQASARWQEADAGSSWVDAVALVPSQVLWTTSWRDVDNDPFVSWVLAYELPEAPATDIVGSSDRSGNISNPGGYHHVTEGIEDCSGMGTSMLCVGSASAGLGYNFSGAVRLYELPLQEERFIPDFRTQIAGNEGERAAKFTADDLDGDGLDDLAIGAYYANEGTGRIGLVATPDPGEFLLWDIAFATFDGVVDGGYAGHELVTGDLDGDGHTDLWVGAIFPLGAPGQAYVMPGPFAGNQLLSQAFVTVAGEDPNQFVGTAGAIGDMNGDGAAELVVGAPYSIYFNSQPGIVALFDAPTQGSYLLGDADITLTSGDIGPDAFGLAIAPGDIDGDGLMDLAIGAPDDSRNGGLAGSLTLVFGASL